MYLTQCQLWLPSLSYLSRYSCQVMFVTKELSAFFLSGEVLLTSELWWWLSYCMWGSNHFPSECRSGEGSAAMSKQGVVLLKWFSEEIHFPDQSASESFCFWGFSQNMCVHHWQQPSPRALSGRMLWNRLVRAQGTAENVNVSGLK